MAVKLIMSWDITPEREQEYFEFVIRDFLPGVQRLGFELSDAWATVYGSQPQIMIGGVLPSALRAKKILSSSDWGSLNNQLQDFVQNYTYKIVEARGGFQF
ncbi:MAG: hypothetical protein JEZ06_17960 [Anaerolineaceae bacterium]|nr:hypothetical protein [Anaerolineaceae bacterium]